MPGHSTIICVKCNNKIEVEVEVEVEARYASRNPPLPKLFCSSEKVAWKSSSHLISVKENSSSKRVTMSTPSTITLPSFNILLSGTDAANEDLAILGLFSIAIELHLSLAGSLCRRSGYLDFSMNLMCITFQF